MKLDNNSKVNAWDQAKVVLESIFGDKLSGRHGCYSMDGISLEDIRSGNAWSTRRSLTGIKIKTTLPDTFKTLIRRVMVKNDSIDEKAIVEKYEEVKKARSEALERSKLANEAKQKMAAREREIASVLNVELSTIREYSSGIIQITLDRFTGTVDEVGTVLKAIRAIKPTYMGAE